MNKFPERLRASLKANNLSQTDLANELNLTYDAINNYCNGKREPNIETIIKICSILHESADYLLGITDL